MRVEDPISVFGYLNQHPGLLPALYWAIFASQRAFRGCEAVLSLYRDPEDESDVYLRLRFRVGRELFSDVLSRLEEIESLYLPFLEKTTGWLQIDVEG